MADRKILLGAGKYLEARSDGLYYDGARVLDTADIAATGLYVTTFVDGDLTAGVLSLTHGKGFKGAPVTILDNNGDPVDPDSVSYTGVNTTDVDLTTQGTLTGTWTAIVR